MRDLTTGIIGIVMLVTFLGVLLWWIKAVPLIVITVCSLLVMLYDFTRTVRRGGDGASR